MNSQQQPVRTWADGGGQAGPFIWFRAHDKPGQWRIFAHLLQVIPKTDMQEGHLYESIGGFAADDGFGNLVLLGGLQ